MATIATSIFFNGRVISSPGAYSEVDASGLDTVSLGATGIVAVLGTAEGGRPVADIAETKDIPRFRSAEKARAAFRSGQLSEVANMLFSPAKDPDIPAGAVEFVAIKVNPSTKSTGILINSNGDVIELESRDYGAFTSQIKVDVQSGTNKGKLLTISFENFVESVDDLGGDTLARLQYVPGPFGYQTAVADVSAGGNITVNATRSGLGRDSDLDNPVTNAAAEIVSDNAADVGRIVELFGISDGDPVVETLVSNGTTVVLGTTVWDAGGLLGVRGTGTFAGDLTVRIAGGGADVFTGLTGASPTKGILQCDNCYVDNTGFTLVADGASAAAVPVFGRNAAGGAVNELVVLNGTTPVASLADSYARLSVIALGDVAAARTVTLTARAARSLASVNNTLQKAANYFNGKSQVVAGPVTEGFIFTVVTGRNRLSPDALDETSPINILSPADADFTADLNALIEWINQNSQLVAATEAAGAVGVPDNTSSPVFLTGGVEGVATFQDYQNGLNLLKGVRVNSIVDLSGDPAVAAALDAHCALMCGIGRSERDGFVGVLNQAGTDVPTKDNYKSAIVDLNTRHLRAFGQAIQRFNNAGERQEYLPPFLGALAAGAQAGSAVGTSLTHKFMNVLGFRQHFTWNPVDDVEEMIQGGACFLENIEGVGRRIKRNVTTHLSSNNIAFVEASVNEAVNFAVFNFRTNLEFIVGKKGFSGTIGATRSVATGTLGLLVADTILTGYRNLSVELLLDVMDVSAEIAPVIPINFVRIVLHLITLAQLQEG